MKAGTWINLIAVTAISVILFVVPLCIEKIKKPSWEQEVAMLLEKKKVNLMEKPAMKRTLTNRNIQLIALGGAIGTGLF